MCFAPARNPFGLSSRTEDLFGVEMNVLDASLPDPSDKVRDSECLFVFLAVPQCDERDLGATLEPFEQSMLQHPEIALPPQIVMGFELKPSRQLV